MTKMMNELSILTVNFHNTFEILLNHNLTELQNKESKIKIDWLICDNTYDCDPIKGTENSNISIFKGISKLNKLQRSIHHGSALNILRDKTCSEFILILDPDFFVLSNNWIHKCITFARNNDLTFIGSPWHPLGPKGIKWFDFPNCHFLLINTNKVKLNNLDFSPAYDEFKEDIKVKSRDTGYRIRQKYLNDPDIKFRLFNPKETPENFINKLSDIGFNKEFSKYSEYYEFENILKGFHLRRTISSFHLVKLNETKKLLNLLIKNS